MPNLPDQMTSSRLRAMLEDYESELSELPQPDSPDAQVAVVKGGELLEREQGYALVKPNLQLRRSVGGLVSPYPIVEVTWRFKTRQQVKEVYLETSPATLLGPQLSGDEPLSPDRQHVISVEARTQQVTARLLVFTQRLALRPLTVGLPEDFEFPEYQVPPTATDIFGRGFLSYRNGPEVWVDPRGPQPLLRLGPEGELQRKQGGVYASFFGLEPAQVKVGHLWMQTPQLR